MSQDDLENNLKKILEYLRKNPNYDFLPEELSKETGISIDSTQKAVEELVIDELVNVDHTSDDGTPCVKINKAGNEKLKSLSRSSESLPSQGTGSTLIAGRDIIIGDGNKNNSDNKINSGNIINSQNTVPKSRIPKWQLLVAIIVGGVVIFGVIWNVTHTNSNQPQFSEQKPNNDFWADLAQDQIIQKQQKITELENLLTQTKEENEKIKLEQIIERLKLADLFYTNGDYRNSTYYYRLALSDDKNNESALDGVAISLARLNEFEDSIKYYDELLALKPDYYVAKINKGWSLVLLERFDKALVEFNELEKTYPDDAMLIVHKCWTLHKLGSIDALKYCKKALDRDENDERALKAYSLSLSLLGRNNDALPYHEKLYKMFPKDVITLINYGNALNSVGRPEDALKIYNEAIGIDPQNQIVLHDKRIVCNLNPELVC